MLASLAALFSAGVGLSAPKLLAQGALVDWAPAAVVAIITGLGWAFTHGTLTEKVKTTATRMDKAEDDIKDHGERIIILEQHIPVRHHGHD